MGQKRAAIYCRVSTADQSCERQERDLLAFAKRAGYEVVGVYKETGSGVKLDRAERQKVMALARARQIDAVLVTEFSRWGRSTLDLLHTLEELETKRISVIALNGMTFDLSTRALSLSVGSAAEPTMHKGFVDVVRKGKEHGVPVVSVTSNAQLLTREHLRDLARAGLDELTLSVHGVRAETYDRLMRKASHARFLHALEMVDEVRGEVHARTFALRLNYTVNPDNLDELPDFFAVYGRFNIGTIQVRPMVDYGNTEYKHKSILPHMPKYLAALKVIKEECKRRGIGLLYNEDDPTYSKDNELAPVFLEGVRRIVRPDMVWAKDYDWRRESYAAYAMRSGFRRRMLDYAIGRKLIEPREPGHATATSAVL